jgi:hypothetical protein
VTLLSFPSLSPCFAGKRRCAAEANGSNGQAQAFREISAVHHGLVKFLPQRRSDATKNSSRGAVAPVREN